MDTTHSNRYEIRVLQGQEKLYLKEITAKNVQIWCKIPTYRSKKFIDLKQDKNK